MKLLDCMLKRMCRTRGPPSQGQLRVRTTQREEERIGKEKEKMSVS